ncbi:uncharacterized protein LOC123532039 [Mercenaria mercenaria]|uniref:uncharacterized protein LOC123532039 n=1 Tax=Mercenaria mercenaria TaxID=6596 RepID=UPI00234F8A67|nr:uncharacterized protein LOC123532039 [Mercenaria mercenaria]
MSFEFVKEMFRMKMDFIRITLFLFYLQCVAANRENEDFRNRILQIESRFRALKQTIIDIKSRVNNADHGLDESKKSLEKTFSNLTIKFEEHFQHVKDKFNKHYTKRERKKLNKMLSDQADIVRSLVEVKNEHTTGLRHDETIEDSYGNRTDDTSLNYDDIFDYGVVFRASVTTKTSFGEGEETIVFSKIDYNMGQGYDSDTGIFIAPRKGTYIFTTQLYVKYTYWIDVGLTVNHDYIALAAFAPGNNGCFNVKAIAKIEKGDSVRVVHISSMREGQLDQFSSSNSFSGVMIR